MAKKNFFFFYEQTTTAKKWRVSHFHAIVLFKTEFIYETSLFFIFLVFLLKNANISVSFSMILLILFFFYSVSFWKWKWIWKKREKNELLNGNIYHYWKASITINVIWCDSFFFINIFLSWMLNLKTFFRRQNRWPIIS